MSSNVKQKKNKKPKQVIVNETLGRPTKYKPEFCRMLIDHMAKPFSFESFAGVIEVDRDTLYEWAKVHSAFSDAKKIGRAKCQLAIEKMLKAQATGQLKGNPASLIFYTKNVTNFRDDPMEEQDSFDEMEFV